MLSWLMLLPLHRFLGPKPRVGISLMNAMTILIKNVFIILMTILIDSFLKANKEYILFLNFGELYQGSIAPRDEYLLTEQVKRNCCTKIIVVPVRTQLSFL